MSAQVYRQNVRDLLSIEARGEDNTGGLEARILSGQCVDFADYKAQCGILQGLNLANTLLDTAMAEMTTKRENT